MTLAVVGDGAEAERCARLLRGVAGVAVRRIAAADTELLACLADDGVQAIAFVPVPELPNMVRRALAAGRHALIFGNVAMTAAQLLGLDAIARARRLVLMLDDCVTGDAHLAFVRKMTRGPQALWRPRYVRALRTGDAVCSIDEQAIGDIGAVLSIAGRLPSRVSAVAPRVDDETGATDVAMVTMMFDGGPVARVDVSMVESEPRREITVACDGRTIVLDGFDARAPLRIQGGRHHGPQRGAQWAETVSEHPMVDAGDRDAEFAASFVAAVRSRDTALNNAADVAAASTVWERARESMSSFGAFVELNAGAPAHARPELRVIHGGGDNGGAASLAKLRVVRDEPLREFPLHSA